MSSVGGSGGNINHISLFLLFPSSEVNGMCGKNISTPHMKLKYVSSDGIQYICTSKRPIKQVSCSSSCEGKCNCRPKDVLPKKRGFICRSCSLDTQEEREETFQVKITTRCICFQCSNSPSLTGSWSSAIYRAV